MKPLPAPPPLPPVAMLERNLYQALQHYEADARYRPTPEDSADAMVTRMAAALRDLAVAADALAVGLEKTRGFDMPRSQLARSAWAIGDALRNRGDVVDETPDDPIVRSDGKPYTYTANGKTEIVTTRLWCEVMVRAAEATAMDAGARGVQAAIYVEQIKANLLAIFDACKRTYNANKPRRPRDTASQEIKNRYAEDLRSVRREAHALFDRLLPYAYPAGWMSASLKRATLAALDQVLCPKGAAHVQASVAIVAPIKMAVEKYMRPFPVSPHIVKEGAEKITGRKAMADAEIKALLDEHRLRSKGEMRRRPPCAGTDL